MKILVCGNLGYVGSTVCQHLKTQLHGIELVGLDTGFFSSSISQFGRTGDTYCDVQVYKDIRDVKKEFYQNFDAVVLLSAISNDPMGHQFEQATNEINYLAIKNLIRNFAPLPNKRLVFASSCSMYGATGGGEKSEDDEINPLTAYAHSKVNVEKFLEKTKLGKKTTTTSLRFATACGMSDRLRLDLVLNDFVASALMNGDVTVLSDGSPWRPLINVKDMARAIEWAILRDENAHSPYLAINIGANEWNYTVKELADAVVKRLSGCRMSINPNAQPDKRSYKVNFDLFKSIAPDHQPQSTIESTIDELIDGITEIQHLIKGDFRLSHFIRLRTLDAHLKSGRLSHDLRWRA